MLKLVSPVVICAVSVPFWLMKAKEVAMTTDNNTSFELLALGLLIAAGFVAAFNAFETAQLVGYANRATSESVAMSEGLKSSGISPLIAPQTPATIAESKTQPIQAMPDVIPKGSPQIYGNELGVNFDDVSPSNQEKANATIKKLGALDKQINLSGAELERYIAIAGQISCEYCCGAKAIIFSDGKAACGCSHSYAMRGLAKYLLKNHGDEYTNDGILEELGKWKTLFFPAQLAAKAKVLQEKGIELNYINIASNKYRGIEKGSEGGMVGGC